MLLTRLSHGFDKKLSKGNCCRYRIRLQLKIPEIQSQVFYHCAKEKQVIHMSIYLSAMFLLLLCLATAISFGIYMLIHHKHAADIFFSSEKNDINLLRSKVKSMPKKKKAN